MVDLAIVRRLMADRRVQAYLAAIDTDSDRALTEMETNMRAMALFPASLVRDYKSDGKTLERALGEFNREWNMVTLGRARNGQAVTRAYSRYVVALEVMETSNARISAFVQVRWGQLMVAFMKYWHAETKRIHKIAQDMERDIKAMIKLLKEAKSDVTEAKVQRALNLTINALSLCLGPTGLVARVCLAATVFTVETAIDAALGPSSGSGPGSLNNAVGATVGLADNIRPPFAKAAGAGTMLISLKFDTDEIAEAEHIVREVQRRMREMLKTMEQFESYVLAMCPKLEDLYRGVQSAEAKARANAARFRSISRKRQEFLKDLKQIK